MKAIWNNTIFAQYDKTMKIEGNHYFPPESAKKEYFQESNSTTRCLWKGKANYFSITISVKTN